jgi:hypothetical protein
VRECPPRDCRPLDGCPILTGHHHHHHTTPQPTPIRDPVCCATLDGGRCVSWLTL